MDESVVPSALYAHKRKPEEQKKFEKAYRELRSKIVNMGLFNASGSYYIFKFFSNLLLVAAAIACAMMTNNMLVNVLGGILLGLFWQQCGWLGHDFLHHQVFKNRLYGDLVGLLIGSVFLGFSAQWWKSKHNSHHAVPNLEASCPDAADGDPDIDTMPMLAWTLRMATASKDGKFGRFMIKWQAVFYFPLLLFARLAWAHQSWVFVWGGVGQHSVIGAQMDRQRMTYPTLEKLALLLHYACLIAVLSRMQLVNAILFFLVAQTSCGLFLATVFGVGHNGMAVYPANQRPDFWKLQVTTTRNVTSNVFVDWFCGGLQYQVEHHLFPMLPRHNLRVVHAMVEVFCKENNVTYHEAGILEGNLEVLQHLSKVSVEFFKEFPGM